MPTSTMIGRSTTEVHLATPDAIETENNELAACSKLDLSPGREPSTDRT